MQGYGSFYGSQYYPNSVQQYATTPAPVLQSTPLSSQRAKPIPAGNSQMASTVGLTTNMRSSSVPPQQPAVAERPTANVSGVKHSPQAALPPRSPATAAHRSPASKTVSKTAPSSPLLANMAPFTPNEGIPRSGSVELDLDKQYDRSDYGSVVEVPVDRVVKVEVPVMIEKIVTVEKIVEVPVDKVVYKEVPVEIEKVIVKEVPIEIQIPGPVVVNEVAVPVDRIVEKEVVKEVPFEVVKIVEKEVPVEVEKIVVKEVPYEIEKIIYKDFPVEIEKIVTKDVAVPVEKIVIQETPVEIVKHVRDEVLVPVEIEKIVWRETPIEVQKFITREVPVEVEKFISKEIPIEVEKTVTTEIPFPVEKIVLKDVPVEVEKIVFREVPVEIEKIVIKDVPVEPEKTVREQPIEDEKDIQEAILQTEEVPKLNPKEVPVETKKVDGSHYSPSPEEKGIRSKPRERSRIASQTPPPSPKESCLTGLGMRLERRQGDNSTTIQELIPGFAAHACGQIMVGDILESVDGVAVEDWDLDELKNFTVGLEGTHVTVELRRGPHSYSLTLVRIHPERLSVQLTQ